MSPNRRGPAGASVAADTFEAYDIEAPGIEPEHFALPVTRAADNVRPAELFLAEE